VPSARGSFSRWCSAAVKRVLGRAMPGSDWPPKPATERPVGNERGPESVL
jgi:hypothetical protein